MNCTKLRVLLALVIVALFASQANAQVFPPSGGGTTYTPASPLPALSGGVGVFAAATPAPGSSDYFEGDSWTQGIGSTSCSDTSTTPSGNCYADLVAIHDGVAEVNNGIVGACFIKTTTSGSACNSANSIQARCASDLSGLTAGSDVIFFGGINDIDHYASDSQVTPAAYRAAVISCAGTAAAVVGASHVRLAEIPLGSSAGADQTIRDAFNVQLDQIAEQYGYALARTSAAIQQCIIANPTDATFCQYAATPNHPDAAGHATVASLVEAANYQTAVGAEQGNNAALNADTLLEGAITSNGNTVAGFGSLQWANSGALRNSLFGNTTGSALSGTVADNAAFGYAALSTDTSGGLNSCFGSKTCQSITTQTQNVAIGYQALGAAASAGNTAIGVQTLLSNTGGSNVAIGNVALKVASTASTDVAIGPNSQVAVTTSSGNTSVGSSSLNALVAGSGQNVAIGSNAGTVTTGGNNSVFIGYNAQPSAAVTTQEIVIGSGATGAGSNTATIGNSSITKLLTTGYVQPTNGFSDVSTTCTGNSFCRAALSAGTYTWTFGHAWTNVPACIVTEESTTAAHTASGVPTTSSVVVTSQTTTGNTDYVDIMCGGRNG